jgi:hypothetical protein
MKLQYAMPVLCMLSNANYAEVGPRAKQPKFYQTQDAT